MLKLPINSSHMVATAAAVWALLLAAAPATAQGLPRPTLHLEAGRVAASAFASPPEAALADAGSAVATRTAAATVTYPVALGGGHTLLFLEAGWRELSLSRRDWPDAISRDVDRLHEVSASVTGRTMLGRAWALTARVTPLLASDFRGGGVTDGDLKFQGAVIAERALGDRWTVGAGAAYSSTFGKPLPLPLLVLRYAGERWLIDGTLPSGILAVRHLSPRIDGGLSLTAEGSLFHIPTVYPESRGIDDPQLQYVAVFAGPLLSVRPTGGSTLTFRGGVAYQSLRLFDGNIEIPDTDYDLDLNAFARAGLDITF
ncbi:hypothetical protein HGA89_00330 [bacterium]|nr:hypothetical protein [bacterium]